VYLYIIETITIKHLEIMKTLSNTIENLSNETVLNSVSTSFAYKMGGVRKLVVDGQIIFTQDLREYYTGRGSKYNSSIKHDNQIYNFTSKEFNAIKKELAQKEIERQKRVKANLKQKKIDQKFQNKNGFILCKRENGEVCAYDFNFNLKINVDLLAKELNVDVDSVLEFLESKDWEGKVYLKTKTDLTLYRPALCNGFRMESFLDTDSNWMKTNYELV